MEKKLREERILKNKQDRQKKRLLKEKEQEIKRQTTKKY